MRRAVGVVAVLGGLVLLYACTDYDSDSNDTIIVTADAGTSGSAGDAAGPVGTNEAGLDATPPPVCASGQSFDGDSANCGRCDHDCAGGACSGGVCQPTIVVSGQQNAFHLVATAGRLFIARTGGPSAAGGVYSVALGQMPIVATHFEVLVGNPGCFALATDGTKMFFVCGSTRNLYSCDLPNCSVAPADPTHVKDDVGADISGLAAIDGKVFYTLSGNYNTTADGAIFNGKGESISAFGQPGPADLVIANGYLYWLNGGTYGTNGYNRDNDVRRRSLTDASAAEERLPVPLIKDYGKSYNLAVDSVNYYYSATNLTTGRGAVVYAPLGGGGQSAFADDLDGPVVVTADGTNVYFGTATKVFWCSVSQGCNGKPNVLAENINDGRVYAITTDEKTVIWAQDKGEIRRVAKP